MKIPIRITLILIAVSLILSACGPEISVTVTPITSVETPVLITTQSPNLPTETPSALGQYMVPAYYPDSYSAIVDGSKSEKKLLIYSNMSDYNWNSVIRIFNTHYPWILVTAVDLGPQEPFARYNNALAENKPTADMIVSSDPVGWLQFFENGNVLSYPSQEDLFIPDTAKSVYGTYAVSSEPMLMIYNKNLVPDPPTSMVKLAEFAKNNPDEYRGQIITTDAELNATSLAINWFWTDNKGLPGWDILSTIGESQPIFMATEDEVVEKVGKGEAKIGYFVSAHTVLPRMNTYPDLGGTYLLDGQPVLMNSMAITQKTTSPNSAKLMMDFILSQEGQYALALGGLTPFRSDISEITDYHLDKIYTELGENNVLLFSFEARLNDQTLLDSFLEKWKAAVHKESIPTPTQ